MKLIRLTLAVLIFSLANLAMTGSVLAASSANETKAEFDAAKKQYDLKNFAASYQAFEKLFNKAPTSWVVNFYMGSAALEMKDYDAAMAAFDRVLMLNPNHTLTRLEMARLYYETGQFEMANNELDIALKSDMPDAVRQNVMALKSKMAHEDKRFNQSATLVLGINHDSNANNDIGRGVFSLPGFNGIELDGNSKESDVGFSQTFVYNLGYDFGERGGWVNNSQFIAYNKSNREFDDNNVQVIGLNSSFVYVADKYRIGLPFGVENVRVGGDAYSLNTFIGANYSRLLTPTQNLAVAYTLKHLDYSSFANRPDANSNILSLAYRQALPKWNMNFGATLSSEFRRKAGGAGIDLYGFNEKGIRLDATKVVNSFMRLNAVVSYSRADYMDENWLFKSTREDKIKRADLSTTFIVHKKAAVNLGFSRTVNSSNQAVYNYDKNLVWGTLTLSF